MAFTHVDLIGLNKHEMLDAPIAKDDKDLEALAIASKEAKQSISIAGMRHSQGGHTALDGGRMVFTEAMTRKIDVNEANMTVTVNAGATWSDLHFHLGPMGLAPLVHQSSPHFSIGGSLSVDCHGREVAFGALSNTVESIKILTNLENRLQVITTSRKATEHPELFRAVLGGYGACGVILEATLRITENKRLLKTADVLKKSLLNHAEPLTKLQAHLEKAARKLRFNSDTQQITMFYAWMNLTTDPDEYLNSSIAFEYSDHPSQDADKRMKSGGYKNEGWSSTEGLRAAWAGGRHDRKVRSEIFQKLTDEVKNNNDTHETLINFLREEISFTSTKGTDGDVDILQEYFVPLANISTFLTGLKKIFPCPAGIPIATVLNTELLTCTLRIIQPHSTDDAPFLSYGRPGQVMVSVALEVKVKKILQPGDNPLPHPKYTVIDATVTNLRKANQLAIDNGGSYYLPYYQIADVTQFKQAYPQHDEWLAQADIWNPKILNPANGAWNRLFNNEFLKTHLDQ